MKSNANLVDLIEKVKPEIRTLIEKCNTVSNVLKHLQLTRVGLKKTLKFNGENKEQSQNLLHRIVTFR